MSEYPRGRPRLSEEEVSALVDELAEDDDTGVTRLEDIRDELRRHADELYRLRDEWVDSEVSAGMTAALSKQAMDLDWAADALVVLIADRRRSTAGWAAQGSARDTGSA